MTDLSPADLPRAVGLLTDVPEAWDDAVVLDYDARLIRRKRLVTEGGAGFLVDLPKVTNLDDHAGFVLADGRAIRIVPAKEDVLVVTGDLPRLAWHIGNRHTPCRIEPDRLIIRADHVLEAMLRRLGAGIAPARMPFAPEGGAYGTGRTMGHAHGPDQGHDHGHSHDDPHRQSHDQDHDHGHGHGHQPRRDADPAHGRHAHSRG